MLMEKDQIINVSCKKINIFGNKILKNVYNYIIYFVLSLFKTNRVHFSCVKIVIQLVKNNRPIYKTL